MKSFYSAILLATLTAAASGQQTVSAPAKPPYHPMGQQVQPTHQTVDAKWTIDVNRSVVVCRILPEGTVVGGGDNCDFHNSPDPVYCKYFACSEEEKNLPSSCGTSFGCQNLDATEKQKQPAKPSPWDGGVQMYEHCGHDGCWLSGTKCSEEKEDLECGAWNGKAPTTGDYVHKQPAKPDTYQYTFLGPCGPNDEAPQCTKCNDEGCQSDEGPNKIYVECPSADPKCPAVAQKPSRLTSHFWCELNDNQGDGDCGTIRTPLEDPEPNYYTLTVGNDAVIIHGTTDESKVVKLSDEEYSNLQKLRQAVVDEEKRLAVKYGAAELTCTYGDGSLLDLLNGTNPHCNKPDHYEFHGQFLLIDKAKPSGQQEER